MLQTTDSGRARPNQTKYQVERCIMAATDNGTTIEKSVTYLIIGILAILFMMFTIVGMKNVQATAERSSGLRDESSETPEVKIDISGDVK